MWKNRQIASPASSAIVLLFVERTVAECGWNIFSTLMLCIVLTVILLLAKLPQFFLETTWTVGKGMETIIRSNYHILRKMLKLLLRTDGNNLRQKWHSVKYNHFKCQITPTNLNAMTLLIAWYTCSEATNLRAARTECKKRNRDKRNVSPVKWCVSHWCRKVKQLVF